MSDATVLAAFDDPVAQELLSSAIPARFAYTARDGTPRVIPIGHHWNGEAFVMATHPASPKVRALQANPTVALTVDSNDFPPHVLSVRGTAAIEIVDGVPDEYLTASRRYVPEAGWAEFEAGVRKQYEQMAKITVTPTWVRVWDFQTRAPQAAQG